VVTGTYEHVISTVTFRYSSLCASRIFVGFVRIYHWI